MLGGVQGFMSGWRFGQEMVEGTEADRKTRAAAVAAQQEAAAKSAAERHKFALEAYKQGQMNTRAEQNRTMTQRRYDDINANAEADRAVRVGGLALDNTRYKEGAPMREEQFQNERLKNEEARLRTQKQQADAAYVDERRKDADEFDKWARGDASMDPERASRWDTLAGIAAQDPKPALAALQKILPQSAELYKAGNLKGISEVWGSPEGKVAMQAWAPAYKTAVGKPVEGGRYVIQDINPNRLEMAGDGIAMILDVNIAPSKPFAEELTRQRAAAKTPEEIARIDRQLAPSTYQAPLTEGRVPVGEGGRARIFTQEEFSKGVSNLQQRVAYHEQHPDEVAKMQRRLLARASGSSISDSLKAEVAMDNAMIQEQLKAQDQALRKEGFDLKKRGQDMKAAGKGGSTAVLNRKFASVDAATKLATRDTFPDGERQSVSREILDYQQQLNIRTKDVLSQNPELSLEEAFKQAADLTPQPQSEVDTRMAALANRMRTGSPAPAQGMSPTGNVDGTRLRNPTTGAVVVFRNGQWVPE
jgi:hypothetical protein